ncbi:MAG: DUF4293 domain-containing protein [Prevotella sp.]|nr:DUF4293 domain-containing protein [Prevotella sp.]
MLQRKQSLYLLLALIATVACMSLPIGSIEPKGMGVNSVVYNLGIQGSFKSSYPVWPLFGVLLLTCPLDVAAIFLFHRRSLQIKLCVATMVLCVIWYAYFLHIVFHEFNADGTFHFSWTVCLPFVAIIFYFLARIGIKDDEKLLKAADRIR